MILAVASLITMGGDDIDRCVEDSGSGFEIINKNLGQINMNLERIRQIRGSRNGRWNATRVEACFKQGHRGEMLMKIEK